EGLGHLLDGLALLADSDGQRADTDRSSAEAPAQDVEHSGVQTVETALVDLVELQRRTSRPAVDNPVRADLGEVADPAKQTVGDAGRAARSLRDLMGAVVDDINIEQAGASPDDAL